jgi:hypothetical protein
VKGNKFFVALHTLEPKAFVRFLKFLRSPYIQEHRGILRLADFIEANRLETIGQEPLERSNLYCYIFENQIYDDLKLRHLLSDALRLLEEFVAVEKFYDDRHYLELNKLHYYKDKGLDKHFVGLERQMRADMLKNDVFGSEYMYYKKFLLERELNQYLADREGRKGKINVTNASQALDDFFILQKLRYGCMQANYGKVFSASFQLFLLEEILDFVASKDLSHQPLIMAYYQSLMMFKYPDDERYFFELKEVLHKDSPHFDQTHNVELFKFAQNYCIGKANMGKKTYLQELFDLFQTSLSHNIALVNGELSPSNFKNMVTVACHLGKFDWAQEFIGRYSAFLPEDQRNNSVTMNTALLYWSTRKLSDAARLLSRVEFDDPFYALDAKSLLLKIYFEQDEKEVLFSFCESFRMYLKRNKLVSKAHINSYNNLISFTVKLIKLKPEQREKFDKIKKDIQEIKLLNNKGWLIEQVQKMDKDYIRGPEPI